MTETMIEEVAETLRKEPVPVPAPIACLPPFRRLGQMADKGKFEFSMPGGMVSESGIDELIMYLRDTAVNETFTMTTSRWKSTIEEVGMDWVTKQGTWPKRFLKELKKISKSYMTSNQTFNGIFTQPIVSEIGSIISRNTEHDTQFRFDIVTHFDWDAGDFGDNGSCFWGTERSGARTAMGENGFLALRFFDGDRGKARCWIGQDPETDLPVMFNGYGMDLIRQVRILATYLGVMYHKTCVQNHGDDSGILYINGGRGFILGCDSYEDRTVDFKLDCESESNCYCIHCDTSLDEDDHRHDPNGDDCCDRCYSRKGYASCDGCGETFYPDALTYVDKGDLAYCDTCLRRKSYTCAGCDEIHDRTTTKPMAGDDGNLRCSDCHTEYVEEQDRVNAWTCEDCGKELDEREEPKNDVTVTEESREYTIATCRKICFDCCTKRGITPKPKIEVLTLVKMLSDPRFHHPFPLGPLDYTPGFRPLIYGEELVAYQWRSCGAWSSTRHRIGQYCGRTNQDLSMQTDRPINEVKHLLEGALEFKKLGAT